MNRERLPPRRPNETVELEYGGARYAVTIGFYPDGPGEAFTGKTFSVYRLCGQTFPT